MTSPKTGTFDLWPTPSPPPTRTSPARLGGATPQSTQTLLQVLQTNHEKWHVFFDDLGRHNHIPHHTLAIWALGGNEDMIQAGYDKNEWMQRPRGTSPESITKENFYEHLGDRSYYNAYVDFFATLIQTEGPARALEGYIFSSQANFGSTNKEGRHPEMLSRLAAAILHAQIHIGYGAEFGLPGMFVEGLAMAAISPVYSTPIIPPALFPPDTSQSVPAANGKNAHPQANGSTNTHAFDILSRIIQDPRMESPKKLGIANLFRSVVEKCGDAVYQYASQWTLDTTNPEAVQRKVEELQWTATLMYAVPGIKAEGGEFNADFIALHFVTSALFLPSLVGHLSPKSQVILLRSYFAISLAWFIALGRPTLDIQGFFGSEATRTLKKEPNPWLPIIENAITHPDDHIPKCQRALLHYATLYGTRPRGSFAETELPGAEILDGTLFVRAARLTMERVGRERKDAPKLQIYWDRRTFIEGAEEDSY
ncbi:hypothetical protein VNI00_015666 [Paramarasmius palmivorus]|uniref:Uncharacterized protein n=1 Tax=Paramarasmius palmivorus TaxID=297713 RepID=A0AAW0BJ88_9AGAR